LFYPDRIIPCGRVERPKKSRLMVASDRIVHLTHTAGVESNGIIPGPPAPVDP
jgi:hypothetical protein